MQLELEGFNPTPTAIKLRVVLRNQRSKTLTIPDKTEAIIRMAGQPDKEGHVSFPAREVGAGGEVHGIIKVAGHDLNPAADLFLPNFLPPAFSDRDLHLTVPISALMK